MKITTVGSQLKLIAVSFSILAAFTLVGQSSYASEVEHGTSIHHLKTEIKINSQQRQELLDAQAAYIEKSIRLEADEAIFFNKEERILADQDINFKALRDLTSSRMKVVEQIEMLDIDALEQIQAILAPQQWQWYIRALESIGDEDFEMLEVDEEARHYEAEIDIEEDEDFTLFSPLLQ